MSVQRRKDLRRKVLFILSAVLLSLGAGSSFCGAARHPKTRARHARRPAAKTSSPVLLASADPRDLRIENAEELLGPNFRRSVAAKAGLASDARLMDFVSQSTRRHLKGRWKGASKAVSAAIWAESRRRGLDPVFLMAVIDNESGFNPAAVGQAGEIGLMQLKPDTAQWVARMYHLPFKGKGTLRDPVQNIRLGTAYMSFLRERFDFESRLYLSAYNMGTSKVESQLGRRRLVCAYPGRVLKHYLSLYAELHTSLGRAV